MHLCLFFLSGSQGRLLYWTPTKVEGGKPISATHPELMARFVKESSLRKSEWLPDVDFIDVHCRNETIQGMGGETLLLQMPLAPAFGLTVHKTQALSIKHVVDSVWKNSMHRFGQKIV